MGERLTRRVLFIGNSYTEGLRSVLGSLLPTTLQGSILVEFVTQGGRNLTWHWQHKELHSKIAQGQWDYVVLQEQSQTPALESGELYDNFVKVTKQFCDLIHSVDATPVMFMTWGAKNGDKQHLKLSPDYATMQARLAKGYRAVAAQNHTRLVPVGEAWAAVRQHAPQLIDKLYQKDGHHPSALGNHISAGMFGRYLWGMDLLAHPKVALKPIEVALIQAAIKSTL